MKENMVQYNSHYKIYTHKSSFADSKSDFKNVFKPKMTNPSFKKKKGNYYICGKPRHHMPQCQKKDEK